MPFTCDIADPSLVARGRSRIGWAARLKLAAMGLAIDVLTEEQARYLAACEEGT